MELVLQQGRGRSGTQGCAGCSSLVVLEELDLILLKVELLKYLIFFGLNSPCVIQNKYLLFSNTQSCCYKEMHY